MITEMTIQNFKMFENLTVSGLSRLNLIGGKNGTGKSTLLEALFLMQDVAPDAFIKQMNLRGITEIPATEQDLWHPFFYNFISTQPIKINAKMEDKTHISLEVKTKIKNDINGSTPVKGISNLNKSMSSGDFSVKELNMIFKNSKGNQATIKQSFINNSFNFNVQNENFVGQATSMIPSNRMLSFNSIFEKYFEISKNNDEDKLVTKINEILDLDIIKFELSPASEGKLPILYVQTHHMPRKMPIHLMAEGIKHILQILILVLSQKCKILLIDEIENGLHYSVLPKLWAVLEELADKYHIQIFVTTHDKETIKEFSLKKENRSYVWLGRTREDKIKATTIKDDLVGFLEAGFEPR